MEQPILGGWCHLSEDISVIRWPLSVDWKKARGRAWGCSADGRGFIGGCRIIDRLAL